MERPRQAREPLQAWRAWSLAKIPRLERLDNPRKHDVLVVGVPDLVHLVGVAAAPVGVGRVDSALRERGDGAGPVDDGVAEGGGGGGHLLGVQEVRERLLPAAKRACPWTSTW